MSDLVNSAILEEAQELINSGDLSGTGLDKALEHNLATNDLDQVWRLLVQARELLRDE